MTRLAAFHVGIVGLALMAFSGHAHAATVCNTGPPPSTPLSGTIVGGVVVNAGNFCILGGANISGGVVVNPGGILIACGTTINGGFRSNGAAELIFGAEEIDCAGDVINGGVQISNTGPGILGPDAPAVALERSTINGAVHLSGIKGRIAVASNRVAGGLFCANNVFDVENEMMANLITGRVTCKFGETE